VELCAILDVSDKVKMTKYDSKMKRINITVPEDLLEEFKKYCENQCRPLSSQLQYMMKEALKESKQQKVSS
jgi:metal-responsive CopG/Arc/MetJ family transcriptional regulator